MSERTDSGSTKVFLVDEHRLFRDGLRALLLMENSPVQVVGEANNAEDALRVLDGLDCDLVSLSVTSMDSGILSIRTLRQRFPNLGILVLASEGSNHVLEAVQEGAAGYLSKSALISDLVIAVETVGKGGAYIHPRAAATVLSKIRGGRNAAKGELDMTDRERGVLELLTQGQSNSDIAERLYLSASTVKSTLRSLFAKLGVNDRTHLVVTAISKGLVSPPPRRSEEAV
ncbi:response regulator transcription factor [bacterium]|nr:response regulator transcription factor [bacterium]